MAICLSDWKRLHYIGPVLTKNLVRLSLAHREAATIAVCYLLRNLSGAPGAVIDNVAAGIFQVPFQLSQGTAGVNQVLRKYWDRKIDLADACLIRLADQFGTADILTLDQDFRNLPLGQKQTFSNAAEPGLVAEQGKARSESSSSRFSPHMGNLR